MAVRDVGVVQWLPRPLLHAESLTSPIGPDRSHNPCREARRGAECGKSARSVVCPAKAGLFSRRQTCRGRNQEPRSLDSREEGNRCSEAYRQAFHMGRCESLGRNESERGCGLEIEWPRRPSPQPKGEGSMGRRNLIDAAGPLRRGGSDGTVARTSKATGETLLAPAEKSPEAG